MNAYADRAFGDGGYLNKPFSHAIETLARRTTGLPMRRKVAYVEPSPDDPVGNQTKAPPNFIETRSRPV